MSRCVSPLSGWIAAQPNDNGRRPVVFNVHAADRERPVDLPCGKCVGCVQDRAESWSVRCTHEASRHERNSFLTLTYANPCPPVLLKGDLQRFFKRLRKQVGKLRYFAVGEYGERTHRPHFHALIFGHDFLGGAEHIGKYYVNGLISAIWGHGHVTIAPCEPDSIFYVCGYSLKNLGDPDCFHICSRRPYIGARWLNEFHGEVVQNGFVTINGIKHAVPDGYLRRGEVELDIELLKEKRQEAMRTQDPEIRWRKKDHARSREINMEAAAAARRGDL